MRNLLLKIVNVILAILFLSQVITGALQDWFNIFSPSAYDVLHVKGGLLFALFVVIHTVLNWGWIRSNYFKTKIVKV